MRYEPLDRSIGLYSHLVLISLAAVVLPAFVRISCLALVMAACSVIDIAPLSRPKYSLMAF